MQIGGKVTFDNGAREGLLISIVGRNAFISTSSGPVQRPVREVRTAAEPVVVEQQERAVVDDSVEIIQQFALPEEAPVVDVEEDNSSEEHALEAQAVPPTPQETLSVNPNVGYAQDLEFASVICTHEEPQVGVADADLAIHVDPGVTQDKTAVQIVPSSTETQAPADGLPQRFSQKWLNARTVDELKAILARTDVQKQRLTKVQEELTKREGGASS